MNADIEAVKHKIAVKRLKPLAKNNPSVADVINKVIDLHERWQDVSRKEWNLASSAAARAAAKSVDWSGSLNSSYYAAKSADWSTISVKHSASWSAEWKKEYHNLIQELDAFETKVTQG